MSYWITRALSSSECHQQLIEAQEVLVEARKEIFWESIKHRPQAEAVMAPYSGILRKPVFKCPCFFAPVAQLPIGPGWRKWDSTEWFQALFILGRHKGQGEFIDLRVAMAWILKEYGILLRPHVDLGNPLVFYADSEDDVLPAVVRFNQDVFMSSGKKDMFRGSHYPNPLTVEEARVWLNNSGQAHEDYNCHGVIPLGASYSNVVNHSPDGPITSEELLQLLMPSTLLNELINDWQRNVIQLAGKKVSQIVGHNP
jgi:hypothetical protein